MRKQYFSSEDLLRDAYNFISFGADALFLALNMLDEAEYDLRD
jgi:hypothetical protein